MKRNIVVYKRLLPVTKAERSHEKRPGILKLAIDSSKNHVDVLAKTVLDEFYNVNFDSYKIPKNNIFENGIQCI